MKILVPLKQEIYAHIYADAKHVGALNLSCVCELIGQGLRKMNEPIIVTNGEFLSNGLDNVEVWAGRCQRRAASFLWLIKILFKLGAESSETSTLSLLTRSLSFFALALCLGLVPLTSGVESASTITASSISSSIMFSVYLESICGNLQQQQQQSLLWAIWLHG